MGFHFLDQDLPETQKQAIPGLLEHSTNCTGRFFQNFLVCVQVTQEASFLFAHPQVAQAGTRLSGEHLCSRRLRDSLTPSALQPDTHKSQNRAMIMEQDSAQCQSLPAAQSRLQPANHNPHSIRVQECHFPVYSISQAPSINTIS